MATMYEVDLAATDSPIVSNAVEIDIVSWSRIPANATRRIPPRTENPQAYYWSRHWQEDEREALADIAAGNVRVFDDPLAAARYLLSEDDD